MKQGKLVSVNNGMKTDRINIHGGFLYRTCVVFETEKGCSVGVHTLFIPHSEAKIADLDIPADAELITP